MLIVGVGLLGFHICFRIRPQGPRRAEISRDFPALKQEPFLEPRASWTWNRKRTTAKNSSMPFRVDGLRGLNGSSKHLSREYTPESSIAEFPEGGYLTS